MAVSRDTDPQKTEYSERNDSGSPSSYGDMLRDPYDDTIYYRDIEQIADLDVYHFGSVERKKGYRIMFTATRCKRMISAAEQMIMVR